MAQPRGLDYGENTIAHRLSLALEKCAQRTVKRTYLRAHRIHIPSHSLATKPGEKCELRPYAVVQSRVQVKSNHSQ